MLKISHIKIAQNTFEKVQSNIDWKINKTAYLLGSIIPDLNCAFPTHTITNTINRFRKKLVKIENTGSNFMKSMTLGVMTHYICDYFCYAHNLKHPDPLHAIYERVMRKHIRIHEDVLAHWGNDLLNQWEEIKKHTIEAMQENSNNEDIHNIVNNIQKLGTDHIQYIIDTIKNMHDQYIEQTSKLDQNKWYNSLSKIQLDLDYATFMSEKISLLILVPKLEISGLI